MAAGAQLFPVSFHAPLSIVGRLAARACAEARAAGTPEAARWRRAGRRGGVVLKTSSDAKRHPVAGKDGNTAKAGHGITSKPWWPWLMRFVKIGFFGVVAFLLYRLGSTVEWSEVVGTLRERAAGGLWIAAALAAASHALYSCFDLLGRHVTGHDVPKAKVVATTFISYAFNLNMGSLIGGVAFRYRLYSRLGLDADTITRVLAMSMITNWLGYLLLAGLAFWWWPLVPPSDWKIDTGGLRILGVALFAA